MQQGKTIVWMWTRCICYSAVFLYAAYVFSVQPTGGTYHSVGQTQPKFCKRSAESRKQYWLQERRI